MKKDTLNAEEVKKSFMDKGLTITGWAKLNGYDPNYVSRVLNGQFKGRYGRAHEIAVKLGLKAGTDNSAVNKEVA